jgi:hypothetical protein
VVLDCSPGPVVLVPEEPDPGPGAANVVVVVVDPVDPRTVVVVDEPGDWLLEVGTEVDVVEAVVVVVVVGGTVVVVVGAGATGTVAWVTAVFSGG